MLCQTEAFVNTYILLYKHIQIDKQAHKNMREMLGFLVRQV